MRFIPLACPITADEEEGTMLSFKRSRRWLGLALLPVVYVGIYIGLSLAGDTYWSQTGRLRYNNGSGLAVSDVERWHPAWVKWEPFITIDGRHTSRGNIQGYFFSPLIRLDRRWFHPDRDVFPSTRSGS